MGAAEETMVEHRERNVNKVVSVSDILKITNLRGAAVSSEEREKGLTRYYGLSQPSGEEKQEALS